MSYSFKSLGMTEAEVFGHDDTNEEGHVTGGFAASPSTNEETSRLIHNPDHPTHFAIRWQDGPIDREAGEGLNGACVEDVLEVCARRLEAYQEGPLDCVENMKAIRLIRSAIDELLLRRTKRRIDGVEGTYEAHEEAPSEDTGAKKDPALPKWQSHKVVEAGKIGRIAEHVEGGFLLTLDLPDNWTAEVQVSQEYFDKHNPLPGGYYVRYPGDGYESWSPAKAFEEGYRLLFPKGGPASPGPTLGEEDPAPPDNASFLALTVRELREERIANFLKSWAEAGVSTKWTIDGEELASGGLRFVFETDNKSYSIVARDAVDNRRSYLGAQGKVLGDGGRDLADGRLTLDTWDRIVTDILDYQNLTGRFGPSPEERPDPVPVLRPSVGRIVHYNDGVPPAGEASRWLAAIITYVHNETMINATVFDENGIVSARTSISLGEGENQWRWPPRV